MGSVIILERDVEAVLVPSGHSFPLKAGTPVRVMQALGGNYSVEVFGNMVMIQSHEVDALGKEPDNCLEDILNSTIPYDKKVIEMIKQCYDPEIPVNIYDLGLIYDVMVNEGNVHIVMTLTSPTCGMGPYIVEEVKRKVHRIQEVKEVTVELVFQPPWDKSRLSDTAKLELNMF